jgi:hypothetical protein
VLGYTSIVPDAQTVIRNTDKEIQILSKTEEAFHVVGYLNIPQGKSPFRF